MKKTSSAAHRFRRSDFAAPPCHPAAYREMDDDQHQQPSSRRLGSGKSSRATWLGCCLVGLILLSALVVGAFYGWRAYWSNQRYYTIQAAHDLVYEIDRKTGRVWRFQGTEKVQVREEQAWEKMELPSEQHQAIDLILFDEVDPRTERLKCRVHLANGTPWTLTGIVLQIRLKLVDGWVNTQKIQQDIYARAHSNGVFSIDTGETRAVESIDWETIQVEGYPPMELLEGQQYQQALDDLQDLQQQLEQIQSQDPENQQGLAKAQLRKRIAQLQQMLAAYEGREEIRAKQPERWKTYQ